MWCLFFATFLAVYSVNGAHLPLPSYIKACKKDDPNLNACALEHAKLAIPELLKGDKTYGIPKLNPLELETVKVETAGNLNIIFNNLKISGLDTVDVTGVKIDLTTKSVSIDLSVAVVNILGKYEMDGKILVLSLKGNGDCNITATNLDVKFNLKYKLIEKDGETYAHLTDSDCDVNLDGFNMYFDNLFNGNKELGKETNDILNKEWNSIYTELKPAISKTVSTIAVTIATRLAEKVPFNMIVV